MAKAKKEEKKKETKVVDYKEEYARLSAEIEECTKQCAFYAGVIEDVTTKMLVTPALLKIRLEWSQEDQQAYPTEFQNALKNQEAFIRASVESYRSIRTELEIVMPRDAEADGVRKDYYAQQQEHLDKYCDKDVKEMLDEPMTKYITYRNKMLDCEEELKGLAVPLEEPPAETTMAEANIQAQVEQKVEEATPVKTPTEGHVYPVDTVKSWTAEMKSYNTQLDGYIELFNAINFKNVDRTWLRKQLQKFVSWVVTQLNKLRDKIVKALKGMMSHVKKALNLISPVLSPPSLTSIISWAMNIISIFTEPYEKIITFIKDAVTYTPPLVAESAKLAATVASLPSTVQEKVEQLEGEGAELVIEEITNAMTGIKFEPISMGDIT